MRLCVFTGTVDAGGDHYMLVVMLVIIVTSAVTTAICDLLGSFYYPLKHVFATKCGRFVIIYLS
ncbi:hypothetical protein JK2ML_0009 [Mycobacterium leprae Kyoto-2]|uniref:Uncharacterized protein n=2 Tax=Mycobacterium leprae TaxID=1769 RepID=Q9CDF0_MYCLE|nr:hypothetical protein A8144_04615 [Mycobacterium leprae 3125609]OAX71553.1 hypothetical protein A3216_05025 [Mycobacterium leprae 7935681]BBC16299.1 hypothetical protein JK2ML_0009 [Mycobacterium leprae Kyoto-2]CAC29517.1 hypothetical protein [Mycobacterium leprae]CAR70102.1 hypothetical protein MLBr00009 [Mycobacterium leprae Br4923]